jgi:hypothetical protein
MKKELSIVVRVLMIIILFGCSKKEATYKVSEVNGIRITENTGAPADSTLKITLKEAATISLETETGYIQPPDYDYHFDTSGNLYFVDYKTNKIHKFDTKGISAAVFGGKGQGPGEFSVQPRIFVSGDTLFAAETNLRRISKFDLNGKYLSEKMIPDIDKFPINPIRIGKNYLCSNNYSRMDEAGQRLSVVSVYILDEKLEFIKEIYRDEKKVDLTQESDPSGQGVSITAGDGFAYLYVNSKTEYRIDVYDESGNKVRSIRKNYIRIESSHEEREWQENFNKKSGMKFMTRFKNSIFNIRADKYNRLWVTTNAEENEKGNNFDIFIDDIFQKRVSVYVEDGYLIANIGKKIVAVNYQENKIKIYEY